MGMKDFGAAPAAVVEGEPAPGAIAAAAPRVWGAATRSMPADDFAPRADVDGPRAEPGTRTALVTPAIAIAAAAIPATRSLL